MKLFTKSNSKFYWYDFLGARLHSRSVLECFGRYGLLRGERMPPRLRGFESNDRAEKLQPDCPLRN